jgi:hypothetical protein
MAQAHEEEKELRFRKPQNFPRHRRDDDATQTRRVRSQFRYKRFKIHFSIFYLIDQGENLGPYSNQFVFFVTF